MPLSGMPGLLSPQNPAGSLWHPAPLATTGKIVFVDSTKPGVADDNVGDDPLRPKATWVAALRYLRSQNVTNRGDQIWLMPNHQETVRLAAGIPMNVAGVSVFGMGQGASRPRITFESDAAASILVSAANCGIYNVVGIANIAGLTQPFDVTGSDCHLDIEWQDTSAALSAARAVLATGADRLDFTVAYRGFVSGTQVVNAVRLNDCNHVAVTLDAYGVNSQAWVEFVSTLSTNVFVKGKTYTEGYLDGSHNVLDSVGGSIWGAEIFDLGMGVYVSGGSGSALAPTYVNAVQLKAILKAAGLLDIGDEIAQLKLQMAQIRLGVSTLVDFDLTEVDSDPLVEF